MLKRYGKIIENSHIASKQGLNVIGVFNPGVVFYNNKYYMFVRVAETGNNTDGMITIPIYESGKVITRTFDKNDQRFDFSDSRVVKYDGGQYLTSMSRLVLFESVDGYNFNVNNNVTLEPSDDYESYGIEDPRMVVIDEVVHIIYVCVSKYGICSRLKITKDFKNFEDLGIILHPDNKDACLFPKKINGKYYLLHRPSTSVMGKPEIWLAESDDLIHYGNHKHIASCGIKGFDELRIGSSSQPIETKDGWLLIYHGCDNNITYSLGAMLLDKNNPSKVLKRSKKPFVFPTEDYEKNGFMPNVIFSCNAVLSGDSLKIYYGACDNHTCLLEIDLFDLLASLED